MWKSLRQYISALGYWGIIIVVPMILDAIGVYQLISGNQLVGIPFWAWFVVAFVLALAIPFAAFHKLRLRMDGLSIKLAKLKDQRPNIQMQVKKRLNDCEIEVVNLGEGAEFDVQAEVLKGELFVISLPRHYSPYWIGTNSPKIEINRGQRGWIRIATLDIDTAPLLLTYTLHYVESHYKAVAFTRSTSWAPGDQGDVKPSIVLRLTISSKPSMIGGAVIKDYELTAKGLFDSVDV